MDSEITFIVEEDLEGGYTAKALGQSIFTAADSLQELRENVREAVMTHYDEGKQPAMIRLHFVKEELIKV